MTLKEIREDYVRYSTNVSELCRNLSYVGIGIVWIFKQSNSDDKLTVLFMNSIPENLRWALILFIAVLVVDLFQYVLQTGIWYPYYKKHKELHLGEDEENVILQEPENYNIVPWAIWIIKLLLVILAYIIMGCFLLK